MLDEAQNVIENLDINISNYLPEINLDDKITIKGNIENNNVYIKDEKSHGKININFHNCNNSKVFIGKNFRGTLNIFVKGDNSIIYIANGVSFLNSQIRSMQNNDRVFIGNKVSSTGNVTMISGGECSNDEQNFGVIIGDDCLFSYNITIRNDDAHPIFNLETMELINAPLKPLILEEHIWIGQNVTILKNVKIGACSIVGLGSIVNKDTPRFSKIWGVPSTYKVDENMLWSRNKTEASINVAKKYVLKYKGI